MVFGAEKKVVKIGFIGPLTGPNAAIGLGARNSADLAIRQANEKGTYPYKLELVVMDDASDPTTGVAAATKLCSDPEVAAATTHFNSPVGLATIHVFHRYGVPQMFWGGIHPDITNKYNYPEVTRICPNTYVEHSTLAKFVVEKLGYKNWSIIYDVTSYGKSCLDAVKSALKKSEHTHIVVNGEEDLLTRFGSVSGPENVGIVFVQVKNAVADAWLQSAGKSLKSVQDEINASTKPASFAFPDALRLSLHIDIETTRATVNNVLAWLPGQSDEYVIVGAHYDHLGRGNVDSLAPSQIGQIHPGADDNASGTAGVLELARLLAPERGQLKRSILFMNFAGEELGLLGSAEWVKEPTRPLGKAVAMINMDMIGRIKDDKVYIGGVGTGSTFKSILEQAQKEAPFKIEYSPGGYSSSDHTSFVAKKIPVLFFFS
jgi:hypothetical protein